MTTSIFTSAKWNDMFTNKPFIGINGKVIAPGTYNEMNNHIRDIKDFFLSMQVCNKQPVSLADFLTIDSSKKFEHIQIKSSYIINGSVTKFKNKLLSIADNVQQLQYIIQTACNYMANRAYMTDRKYSELDACTARDKTIEYWAELLGNKNIEDWYKLIKIIKGNI